MRCCDAAAGGMSGRATRGRSSFNTHMPLKGTCGDGAVAMGDLIGSADHKLASSTQVLLPAFHDDDDSLDSAHLALSMDAFNKDTQSATCVPSLLLLGHARSAEFLGRGAHSEVYKCRSRHRDALAHGGDACYVAVKRPSSEQAQFGAIKDTAFDNFKRNKCLHHENLVCHIALDREGILVMEYVDGGSLADFVARCGPLGVDMVSRVATDVVRGLAHLHAQGMIHRDVKPANILIDSCSGTLKLCDWISEEEEHAPVRGMHALAVSPVGTPVFLAPEVVRTGRHCVRSDTWALACTLVNLISGRLPWADEDNVFAAMFKTAHGFAPPYSAQHMGVFVDDLLTRCFQSDATLRPDAKDLLEHPLC